MEFGAVQLSNRVLRRRRFRHLDKCETAGLARVPVCDDVHAFHAAVSGESRMKIVLGSLIAEISDKYVCHSMNSFLVNLSLSDCLGTNLLEGKVAARRHSEGDTDAGKDICSVSRFLALARSRESAMSLQLSR